MPSNEETSNFFIGNIYLGLAIFFSTLSTILIKSFSNHMTSYIDDDEKAKDYFNHPFVMDGIMFIGEYICLLFYIIGRYALKVTIPNKNKKPIPPYYYSIPALCDFVASGISYLAYGFAAGSVVMMMQSSMIVWTALLSFLFLRQRYYSHQLVGLLGCIIGIILIGFSTLGGDSTTSLFGFILLIIANLVQAIQVVVENKLFANYEVHVFECVGFEGVFGLLYCLITFPFFQHFIVKQINMSCINHNEGPYVYNFPCSGVFVYERIEDFKTAIIQLGQNHWMCAVVVIYGCLIPAINATNQGITKYLSGTSRAISSIAKMTLVWIICLIISWELFLWLQLAGFIVSNFGFFLYSEIFTIPGLDYNTLKNRTLRESSAIQVDDKDKISLAQIGNTKNETTS